MKLYVTIFAVAIAASMLLATAFPAFANGDAPLADCQPGAGNDLMSSWELMHIEEYAQLLVDSGKYPDLESAQARAAITYGFCDKNGDNYTCVMQQHLPNDANGSSLWFLIEDNHFPFGEN
jgi:hypothetical protein